MLMRWSSSNDRPAVGGLLAMLAGCLVGACGGNEAPDEARSLLAEVREAGYREWSRAPGYENRRPTAAPHGDEVDIYVNGDLAAAVTKGAPSVGAWPVGSIVVKDGWDEDGATLEIIAVMEKRSDGWFFAEYHGESGDPDFSGRPAICLDCHVRDAHYDRILAFPLPASDG